MGEMLAVPFTIQPSGLAATVDDNSDAGIATLISAAVLTRLGERPMWPTFGIGNPVFNEVDAAQVAAVLAAYGPSVEITDIITKFTDAVTQEVKIEWRPPRNVES